MAKGKKWELILKEVESLVGGSNVLLFDRVTKLQAVYDDPEFRRFHGDVIDAMDEHLDKYVGDYGLSFSDLTLVLRYYPARVQWETGQLREMLAMSLDRRDSERKSDKPAVERKRSVVTHKEFEAVQKQAEQEATRAKSLASELADRRSEVERLRDENRELTRQLARAEGRISELERMLKGELAAS